MRYLDALAKLSDLAIKKNQLGLPFDDIEKIEAERWELVNSLYRSKRNNLHLLGWSEFSPVSVSSYCASCCRKDKCPVFENLEEGLTITECRMHKYYYEGT